MQGAPGPALVCRALEPFANHVMTTRAWALGAGRNSDADSAWAEVAAALDRPIVRAHQVHGADLLVRRAGDPPLTALPDADIIVSNDPTEIGRAHV